MFALSLFVGILAPHHPNIESHTSLLTTLCVIHAARSGIISSVGARENGKKHIKIYNFRKIVHFLKHMLQVVDNAVFWQNILLYLENDPVSPRC